MIWQGKELRTIGDISTAMAAIVSADDQAGADKFMELMRAEGQHADANVGYLTGYFDGKTSAKMRKMFGVRHPIFGDTQPTVDEALKAGMEMAKSVDTGQLVAKGNHE